MKLSFCLVLSMVFAGAFLDAPKAEPVDLEVMRALSEKFDFTIQHRDEPSGRVRFLYADNSSHIHVYRLEGDQLELDWEQTNLGSRVTSMFITELYGDGRPMLVYSTFGGRILVYDMDGYDLEWENLQDPFESIHYMVAENVDLDPQLELIFIAVDKLVIYDSLHKTFEWVSQQRFAATEIKMADLDDDPQLEIILNSGVIIDSKFYNIELEADKPFGARMFLFDLNGDGIPEIFGESSDYTLRVYDRYAEREIW